MQGPFDTREEAIDEGKSENPDTPFLVCEASNPPIRLSAWLNVEYMIENAEEDLLDSDRACSEYDNGDCFTMTKEQRADLVERVKQAVEKWQDDHALVFKVRTFEDQRNEEWIEDHAAGPETT